MRLKYGCNPHQAFAEVRAEEGGPLELRNGTPSLINLLDALNRYIDNNEHLDERRDDLLRTAQAVFDIVEGEEQP